MYVCIYIYGCVYEVVYDNLQKYTPTMTFQKSIDT